LEQQIAALQARRARVVEAFLDGALTKKDRDERLKTVDGNIQKAQVELAQQKPTPTFDPDTLAAIFEPFRNWELLGRAEKRRMLNAISPEFVVADYRVKTLKLLGVGVDINNASRSKTAPSVSPVPPCRSLFPRASCWPLQ
jgi:hypothetical protein